VNLFLAVGKPDARGYHPLRTRFQAVGLFDELTLDDEAEPGFVCHGMDLPAENTVTKSLRMLSEYALIPSLRIELTKRIPHEAGLGGGSSDAAGLMRGIKPFLVAPIAEGFLKDIAIAVGADVPFFLVGGRARATGYGEVLEPLPDSPTEWYLIVKPPDGVPTGPAFRALDALDYPWRDFPERDELYNDFERVAPCICGDLCERLMVHGARDAALTGSGSAVFGRFSTETQAHQAQTKLSREVNFPMWVVPTLTRSKSLAFSG
jgi:4-diphosphocytidyl-2-C-methyl-D-erythritol kinase